MPLVRNVKAHKSAFVETQHLNAYGKYLSASYCTTFIISFVNIVILKETFTKKKKTKTAKEEDP